MKRFGICDRSVDLVERSRNPEHPSTEPSAACSATTQHVEQLRASAGGWRTRWTHRGEDLGGFANPYQAIEVAYVFTEDVPTVRFSAFSLCALIGDSHGISQTEI